MVQEKSEQELPIKLFVTDNGEFQIKAKGFTLERFETKLCSDKIKAEPAIRDNIIDRWVMFRTRPVDKFKPFKREDLIKAWDELKEYLFKNYEVS